MTSSFNCALNCVILILLCYSYIIPRFLVNLWETAVVLSHLCCEVALCLLRPEFTDITGSRESGPLRDRNLLKELDPRKRLARCLGKLCRFLVGDGRTVNTKGKEPSLTDFT